MSGRQILLDTLQGKRTDRVPVSPFFYNNTVNEANGGPPADPIAACADLYRKYDFDILLRNFSLPGAEDMARIACDSWQVRTETTGTPGTAWEVHTTVTTPERQMTECLRFRRVTKFYVVQAVSEYFIKGPEDLAQFEKYLPPLGTLDCSGIARARAAVGEDGVTSTWIHSVFNMAERYRGLQDLVMDPYIDEDFYRRMMSFFLDRLREMVRQVGAAGSDLICDEGNMANGSMTGPKMFTEFVLPWENRLIDAIHGAGCFCQYHNCGDAKSLLPVYNGMKMDLYESLTPPPFGDTVLADALRILEPPKVLSGNLDQIEFLVKAKPDEVSRRVRGVLEAVKPRGHFILAASDYISEGTPPENLTAFSEAAHEYGRY